MGIDHRRPRLRLIAVTIRQSPARPDARSYRTATVPSAMPWPQRGVVFVVAACHPKIEPEKQSITNRTYSNPVQVRLQVTFATPRSFGAGAVKSR